MTNIRVHEYAKQKDVPSKLILTKLADMGFEVKGHMSILEDEMLSRLNRLFNPEPKSDPKLTQAKRQTNKEKGFEVKKAVEPVYKQDPTQMSQRPTGGGARQSDGHRPATKPNLAGFKSGRPSRPTKVQHAYSSERGRTYQPPTSPGQRPMPRQNRPGQTSQPAQAQGQMRQQQGQMRPAQGQTRPAQGQTRPTQGQTRPTQNQAARPAAQGQRQQARPQQTSRPAAQGQGQKRPFSGNRPARPQTGGQNAGGSKLTIPKPPTAATPAQQQSTGGSNYNRQSKPVAKSYVSKKQAEERRRQESKAFGTHRGGKQEAKQPVQKVQKELPEKITYTESLTVAELAKKLHREASEIIKKLFMMGVVTTINSYLDKDAIELICVDYGVEVEEIVVLDKTDLEAVIADDDASLNTFERPAVVTIMGHVDHGKTTLLDSIRKTKVTEEEAGGITQHIGAYQVDVNDKKLTFLDTPGHAAFTTMRARGAQVTDVVVIVVAADDGVMPQTIEAINHAKAAEVPIIIAVNKMDKPEANPERVRTELSQHGIVPEDWGGDNIFVPISAKMGEGIDELLENILLVSEVAELKCNENRLALGTVIEAKLDKGRGPVATLLVQNGTLRVGDPIVVGTAFGKVRAMVNDLGKRVEEALPSTPIEITGLNEVPQAGDLFVVFEDEKTARSVGEKRATAQIVATRNETKMVTLDNLFEQLKEGEIKELNVILKADVQGSAEAVAASLQKIDVEGVRVKIIHQGAGAISESDVLLATSSGAIVIGFNVRPTANARKIADTEKVDIRIHNIIYNVIHEIESAMIGMLDPEYEEKTIGQAEVRQLIKISKIGIVAGSYVTDGKISRGCKVRVIRDGVVIHDGDLEALKRFKDDVKDVTAGYECGISIVNYNNLQEGDIIEAYVMEEIERKVRKPGKNEKKETTEE